jgi:hypothetical protein
MERDLSGDIELELAENRYAVAKIGDRGALLDRLEIVQLRRRVFPQTLDPIRLYSFLASYSCTCATAALDRSVRRIVAQDHFKVAAAIGIKPVDNGSHRVKGHLPHLHARREHLADGLEFV